jgi:hypothetical protein
MMMRGRRYECGAGTEAGASGTGSEKSRVGLGMMYVGSIAY